MGKLSPVWIGVRSHGERDDEERKDLSMDYLSMEYLYHLDHHFSIAVVSLKRSSL